MNLFQTKVQALQNKSNDIVDVFTKAKTQLGELVGEIRLEKTKKLDEINALKVEFDTLENVENRNLKVIGNIEKLLQ